MSSTPTSQGAGTPISPGARPVDIDSTGTHAPQPYADPTDAQRVERQPPEGEPSEGQPSEGQPSEGQPPDAQPPEGEPGPGEPEQAQQFSVRLENFEGPFDLLLQLISKHKLDITEVALSRVTDEFIAHIKALGDAWDLEQTSQFIVVAATLLDLKAARLLPSGEIDDPEDLALLEARDLLFARLLQYRAFKEIAAAFSDRLDAQAGRLPRRAGLDPQFTQLLPEVSITVSPERFAELAARAMAPKEADVLSLSHLHAPVVSVREQAEVVVERLRSHRQLTFRQLATDADRLTTVCRFLALLELFREHAISFEQPAPLAELIVRWTGSEDQEFTISDEFDVAFEDGDDASGTDDENTQDEDSEDEDYEGEDSEGEDSEGEDSEEEGTEDEDTEGEGTDGPSDSVGETERENETPDD